jgi:hypothetical protein
MEIRALNTHYNNILTPAVSDAEWLEKRRAEEAKGAAVLRARGIDPGFTTLEKADAIKRLETVTEEPVLSNDAWLAAARARCATVELELRASSHVNSRTPVAAEVTADDLTVRTRPA